jgi:hypothetical protein
MLSFGLQGGSVMIIDKALAQERQMVSENEARASQIPLAQRRYLLLTTSMRPQSRQTVDVPVPFVVSGHCPPARFLS